MKSKASFRSHPIHPSLIPFPFAFLLGSVVFDLLGWASGTAAFTRTASHLVVAGLVTAVFAAVPGVIDYVYSVPPRSSGKKRALKHAMANVSALVLFALSWGLRGPVRVPSAPAIALELLGAAALLYAGWQGGVLVTRNMISVDHRHAQAGKWNEMTAEPGSGPIVAARKDELKEGQMKLVRVGDRRIVLARTDEGYAAFDDGCTHRGGSLADGVLIGGIVQCLWHGSRFECATGKVACGPAKKSVGTYRVSEEKGAVVISLENG